MADGVNRNLFLVNAPAGSGKTTWIKSQVEKHLLNNPADKVLCITYTNRAAEELSRGLDTKRVYTGTIHSFINSFIGPFFSHADIVNLYFDIYEEEIRKRIDNAENNERWKSTNDKYVKKHGKLDFETVRMNVQQISYNEAPSTYFYGGALGHDDLIKFAKCVVERFPVISKKISKSYQLVFIDEYQDTASDVLYIFYKSIIGTGSKLFLMGDKMQQIYKNYNGDFEKQFGEFDRSLRLSTNYRTTPKIVEILNAIYNDDDLRQNPYEKNHNDAMDFMPKVLIVEDIEKCISEFQEKYEGALILYVSNRARFQKIGAGSLYNAYSNMEKYKYGRKYTAVDVLTKPDVRDFDILLSFLCMADQIIKDFQGERYGEVLRCIRMHTKCFDNNKCSIRVHADKERIRTLLESIVEAYNNPTMVIESFLSTCLDKGLIKSDYYDSIVEDPDYQKVKNVKVREVKQLFTYLEDPDVSTQHGVKGESHDTVVFVAENSFNPPIHMKEFFELWSRMSIKLSDFDDFYYKYIELIKSIETEIGGECSKLNKDSYKAAKDRILSMIQSFASENSTDEYYINLLKDKVDNYLNRPGVTTARNCLKDGIVYGTLCAYRLFYVGCSRSRKNLAIVLKKSNVEVFETELCKKFEECGFEVECEKV